MLTTVICKNLRRLVRSCFVSSCKFWYGFRIYLKPNIAPNMSIEHHVQPCLSWLQYQNVDVISEIPECSILLPQWTLWLAPPPTSPSSSSFLPLSLGFSSRPRSDQALHCVFAEGWACWTVCLIVDPKSSRILKISLKKQLSYQVRIMKLCKQIKQSNCQLGLVTSVWLSSLLGVPWEGWSYSPSHFLLCLLCQSGTDILMWKLSPDIEQILPCYCYPS